MPERGNGGPRMGAQLTTDKLAPTILVMQLIAYTSVQISAWWTSFLGPQGSDFWIGGRGPSPPPPLELFLRLTSQHWMYCWTWVAESVQATEDDQEGLFLSVTLQRFNARSVAPELWREGGAGHLVIPASFIFLAFRPMLSTPKGLINTNINAEIIIVITIKWKTG